MKGEAFTQFMKYLVKTVKDDLNFNVDTQERPLTCRTNVRGDVEWAFMLEGFYPQPFIDGEYHYEDTSQGRFFLDDGTVYIEFWLDNVTQYIMEVDDVDKAYCHLKKIRAKYVEVYVDRLYNECYHDVLRRFVEKWGNDV